MMGDKCLWLFLIIWTVLLHSKANGAETKPKSFTVCQNGQGTIRCQGGEVNIVEASFGRQNKKTCPGNNTDKKCFTGGEKAKAERECFRKDVCTLQAKTSVFGDSCPGVSKYLQVKYSCKDYPKYLVICDKYKTTLKCPKNFKVDIVSAYYGRSNKITCFVDKVSNPRCVRSVKPKLRSICNGKMKCDVKASAALFGNPCPNTSSYLEIKYRCTNSKEPMMTENPSKPASKPVKIRKKHLHICDGHKKALICYKKYGRVIEVLKATYGGSGKTCSHHKAGDRSSCQPIYMTSSIKRRCDGNHKCHVSIPNKQFPDPCPGIEKQAIITYHCRKKCTNAQFECKSDKSCVDISKKCDGNDDCKDGSDEQECPTETTTRPMPAMVQTTVTSVSKGKYNILVCEDDDRIISCKKKKNLVLSIKKASYGRNSIRKCSGTVGTIKCGPVDVSHEVKKQCNGKYSCTLKTPVKDPCQGTTKYFEINYDCV